MRAIPRAHPRGARAYPSTLRRVTEGPESRAKALGPRFRGDDEGFCFVLDSRVPLGRGKCAKEKARQGHAQDARAFAAGHGWPVSKPPQRACVVAGFTGDRGREGVFSLVTFSCTSKRK